MEQERNYEKEVIILQQQLSMVMADKVMIQAMYDDALEKINKLQNPEPTE